MAAEIKALQEQTPTILTTPDCKQNTPVGKLIAGLSGKTKPETVEKLAGLTAEDETRLQTLAACVEDGVCRFDIDPSLDERVDPAPELFAASPLASIGQGIRLV